MILSFTYVSSESNNGGYHKWQHGRQGNESSSCGDCFVPVTMSSIFHLVVS